MEEIEEAVVGQVELDSNRHLEVHFRLGDTDVSATLPPTRNLGDEPYVTGIEETIDEGGERVRRYLKIPRRLRSATDTVVEYYDSHENLQKGAKAAAVVAGAIAVGSLCILRYRHKK
jgi:hypothetical protein